MERVAQGWKGTGPKAGLRAQDAWSRGSDAKRTEDWASTAEACALNGRNNACVIYLSFLQDEFLDVIYWFRQIIAVVLGVIWGVLPLRGFLGIAGFCLINAGVLYLYFSNYLQIDEEEYGGTWELTKEGFMTSFALFMVIWIIFYTAIHYD
ncbi:hypothetical protein TREES_T100008655 [Tupaia chinensis]|uniref:RAB5 interacting factor n=1 Tax=Tupaia chinensis TaxID=246437 RepID=L9L4E5_TUPCH|nr:hypothetical protein TREES_T100008655 [Tupaia chinensis]